MSALMTFESHIDGKNATVSIYPDRIEWEQKGRMTVTRLVTTGGLAGRKGGGTEMILMRAITSVTTKKDGEVCLTSCSEPPGLPEPGHNFLRSLFVTCPRRHCPVVLLCHDVYQRNATPMCGHDEPQRFRTLGPDRAVLFGEAEELVEVINLLTSGPLVPSLHPIIDVRQEGIA